MAKFYLLIYFNITFYGSIIWRKEQNLLSLCIMKKLHILATTLLLTGMVACGNNASKEEAQSLLAELNNSNTEQQAQPEKENKNTAAPEAKTTTLYGIDTNGYDVKDFKMESGEYLGKILGRHGVSATKIDAVDKAAKSVFPSNKHRAGNKYTLFLRNGVAEYMVYHINDTEYVVYDIPADKEPSVRKGNAK